MWPGVIVAMLIAAPAGLPSPSQARETAVDGVVTRIPYVGTLRWRCDARDRFYSALRIPERNATVITTLRSDGVLAWKRRALDPGQELESPAAAHRQYWRIRYRHSAATIVAHVRMRFASSPNNGCRVARTSVVIRRPR
jgi:hypothetical protein